MDKRSTVAIATFIRNFRINDSLTVDVILLQATDSAGWSKT